MNPYHTMWIAYAEMVGDPLMTVRGGPGGLVAMPGLGYFVTEMKAMLAALHKEERSHAAQL